MVIAYSIRSYVVCMGTLIEPKACRNQAARFVGDPLQPNSTHKYPVVYVEDEMGLFDSLECTGCNCFDVFMFNSPLLNYFVLVTGWNVIVASTFSCTCKLLLMIK